MANPSGDGSRGLPMGAVVLRQMQEEPHRVVYDTSQYNQILDRSGSSDAGGAAKEARSLNKEKVYLERRIAYYYND